MPLTAPIRTLPSTCHSQVPSSLNTTTPRPGTLMLSAGAYGVRATRHKTPPTCRREEPSPVTCPKRAKSGRSRSKSTRRVSCGPPDVSPLHPHAQQSVDHMRSLMAHGPEEATFKRTATLRWTILRLCVLAGVHRFAIEMSNLQGWLDSFLYACYSHCLCSREAMKFHSPPSAVHLRLGGSRFPLWISQFGIQVTEGPSIEDRHCVATPTRKKNSSADVSAHSMVTSILNDFVVTPVADPPPLVRDANEVPEAINKTNLLDEHGLCYFANPHTILLAEVQRAVVSYCGGHSDRTMAWYWVWQQFLFRRKLLSHF